MKTKRTITFLMAFFIAFILKSQAVYTNFHDVTWVVTGLGYSVAKYFDVNNDGTNDFRVALSEGSMPQNPSIYFGINALNSNAVEFEMSSYYETEICAWNNLNDTIDENSSWYSGNCVFFYEGFIPQYYTMGYWNQNTIGFAGLKFISPSNMTYYGWFRAKYYNETSILFDYAFGLNPGEPIVIGEGIDNRAQIYNVEDVGDYGNGWDLKVEFDKIFDESQILKYRTLVVKADSAENFNLEKANAVPVGSCYDLFPGGNNKSFTLPNTAKDVDGDFITNGIMYCVYILSIDASLNPEENQLSIPSEEISLAIILPVVTDIVAYDGGESGTASDLMVRFAAPDELESEISQYRMIAVEKDSIANFGLEDARMLQPDCYSIVIPDGSEIYIGSFDENTLDCYGNAIVPDKAYYIKVLSVPFNVINGISSLSENSTVIALHIPSFLKAGEQNSSRVDFIDLIPDMVAYNDNPVLMDLNEDGNDDIKFSVWAWWTYPPGYNQAYPLFYSTRSMITSGFVEKLADSTMISKSTINWNSEYGNFYYHYFLLDSCTGNWTDGTDGFLAFAVIEENDTVYGWVKLKTYCSGNITIRSFARLKDYVLDIKEADPTQLTIAPNPVSKETTLYFKEPLEDDVEIRLVGLMGQTLKSIKCTKGQTQQNFNFEGLPKGIYLVHVLAKDESKVIKVLKD